MVRTSAWFLNLDAEDELARPAGYTPSRATLARIAALVPHVRSLLLPGDIVLSEPPLPGAPRVRSPLLPADIMSSEPPLPESPRSRVPPPAGDIVSSEPPPPDSLQVPPPPQGPLPLPGLVGRAWCPTPRAHRAFVRAGIRPAASPPLSVLRAVNHRRFSASLGQGLPGARYVFTPEDVAAALASPSPSGRWLLKRPFGYAGRGRLQIDLARTGDLSRAQPWIEASLRAGEGLQIEPLVERRGDFALHGHLAREGAVVLGEPTRQECDATGAWSATHRAAPDDLSPSERRSLLDEAHRTAAALREAGYFGPFGIDGFRWELPSGELQFHPRGEINARYSMGWSTGMGDRRPDLETD